MNNFSSVAPRFYSYLQSQTVTPTVKETTFGKQEWIAFGAKNDFPDKLRELVDNCAPLGTCVNTTAKYIAGAGLELKVNGEEDEAARRLLDEWLSETSESDFLFNTGLDIALMQSKAWDVRTTAGGDISRIDHKDISMVRSGRMEQGVVPWFWYSSDWSQYRRNDYTPEATANFDIYGPNERLDVITTIYRKAYKQGKKYYSEPWYMGVIRDAQIWAEVSNSQYRDATTGFMPMFWMHLWSAGDDAQANQVEDAARYQFTGPDAQSCVFTVGQPGVEQPPILQELNRGNVAEVYSHTRDKAESVIYEGYGLPKDLVGIMPHGLTSQSESIRTKEDIFYTHLIKPLQRQFITSDLEKLFKRAGMDVKVSIKRKETTSEHIEDSSVKTINELRLEKGLEEIEGGEAFYNQKNNGNGLRVSDNG